MKGNRVASPVSTGGGGEQFEQHVAAMALGLLLVRATPPVLIDTSVVKVHLQTRQRGWHTDDVLVIGQRGDGSRRQLALQVKRSFRISAHNDECRQTILGMWKDFLADRFDESHDQLAVATLHGTSVLLRDFLSLLECARASDDAEDFAHRLSLDGFLSKTGKQQNRAIRRILMSEGAEPWDEDSYWRFLQVVNVLSYDLNTATSQTKAWMLSLLAACTANGSETNTAARTTWARLLECAGQGRPAAKEYTRQDLPPELQKRHTAVSGADRGGLTALVEHGQTVRDGIRSAIGDGYAIERFAKVQSLVATLAEHSVVIVSGVAGSGKSALARELVTQMEDRYPVLSFQAVEFATAHVDQALANAQTSLNMQRLLALLAAHDRKVVLVDGIERLLEHSVRDGFSQLMQLTQKDPATWIVLTVRDYSLETVRTALIPPDLRAEIVEVPRLTADELDAVADGVPALARALEHAPLRAFLRTPYLLDLASRLHWGETPLPVTLRSFRRKVWRELIRDEGHATGGMPTRRERVFLDIAWRRAKELRPFVPPGVDDPAALEALSRDSLVAASPDSSAVYAVTHDVLEDWGVLQGIADRFMAHDGAPRTLAASIGGYPALRRGFRQWLAEWLEMEAGEAHAFVLRVIDHDGLAAHFRDDCVAAALMSEAAATFVQACGQRVAHGNLDLLFRVTHVLRVACKESPKWLALPGLPTPMLVPTGAAWAPTLRLVLDRMEDLLPDRRQLVLGLVEDWARQIHWQNPAPEGAAEAGAIVNRLLPGVEDYHSKDARERTLRVMASVPGHVPRFKDLMERARTCGHRDRVAYGLFELIATQPAAGLVCLHFPDAVIALLDARLRLSHTDSERERGHMEWSTSISPFFGLRELSMAAPFFPPSALQGPFGTLLRHHPKKAVAFMFSLLNHAGRSYASPQTPEQPLEQAWEISLAIPSRGTVQQWANGQLYGLYRGNTVGPNSIASLLMAFESWLLQLGGMDDVDLEGWLVHVLANSNNVMAAGVVASVCVAHPDKAGRAGLALLSSRDIVQMDRTRLAMESTVAPGVPGVLVGVNPRSRLFEQERAASNKLHHRREDLESLAVRMQTGRHREKVWTIIDRHRQQATSKSAEHTREWRLALHRMDIRGFEPQDAPGGAEPRDSEAGQSEIYLGPGKMEADVQDLVDESDRFLSIDGRYARLATLASKMWERDASVGDVDWRTTLLAEARAVERAPDQADELYRNGPGFAAALCIRDHLKELSEDELQWCARRVDFEVRRDSDTTDHAARASRLVRADRVCASVVPLLVVHPGKTDGVDSVALLSLALTHTIHHVSEYALAGLGALVGDEHKALALRCVAAAVYRSRLESEAWEMAQHRHLTGLDDVPDPFACIGSAVRQGMTCGSLNAEEELRRLPFDGPAAGAAVRAGLAVFEHRPDWEEAREFYTRVVRWLVDRGREDSQRTTHTRRNHSLEYDALQSLAGFVLGLPGEIAVRIIAPVVRAVADCQREIERFVSGLISKADRNEDDCFWSLWQRLADGIVRSPWGRGLKDDTSFGLDLLHMIFLGPYWKEDANHWHRLEGHAHHIDECALRLPATVPVMRAYTDYLSRVGHKSLPESFRVVSQVLANGDATRIASESGVAFNLETLLRPFVYSQPHRIKTDAPLRRAVVIILDALVAGGSASAYRMRDDFVTPQSEPWPRGSSSVDGL